jgi:hypothetical protein
MLDWLRLIRASGLATIISNSLAAVFTAFYAGEGDRLLWLLARLKHNGTEALWVLLASFLLYAAGMVWNDLIDVDRDRVGNPKRPLPAGRIGLVPAYVVGILTVLGAVLAAMHVEYGFFLAGIVLSLALLYNLVAKSVPWLGSLVMAATRAAHACFALLLLGPDYVRIVLNPGEAPPGQVAPFVYPLVLGIYIFGLTLVSELEERAAGGGRRPVHGRLDPPPPARGWRLAGAGAAGGRLRAGVRRLAGLHRRPGVVQRAARVQMRAGGKDRRRRARWHDPARCGGGLGSPSARRPGLRRVLSGLPGDQRRDPHGLRAAQRKRRF